MVTAIVLITTENGRVREVAQNIIALEGVTEAYSVTGDHDLVAIVRLADFEALGEVVPGRIAQVEGITKTETMVAFRAYSNYDLDRAWSMGFEE